MPYTYPFPRPAVTCDVVVFTIRGDDLVVLLVKRKDDPYKGAWALPGGFVDENEPLDRAALRELQEETGVSGVRLEQLGAFGDPGRDPRGHTVTVAWVTFLVAEAAILAGDDAAEAQWHPFRSLALDGAPVSASVPPAPLRKGRKRPATPNVRLAFDHAKILARAYRRICKHLDDPVRDQAFDIMPPRFTLAELKRIYDVVLGRTISPNVIKRYIVDRGLAVPAASKPAGKRSTQLYRWNRR
ncbi:MAG TPA: NUDIX domain-containing protein [Labilithrix sp.]